jgi:cellulose synthase/poly-beta-1,6-N-acetylglucosamine synthase-like glycosyltransferase
MIIGLLMMLFLVILADLMLIIIWLFPQNEKLETPSFNDYNWPKISILVAARNEEKNIGRCLKSLLELDYEADKLEILVGDDFSDDNTYSIADNILYNKVNGFVVKINSTLANQKGKANVLAQLAQKATGEFLFITDADIEVRKTWIKGMLSYYKEDTGIISGVTGIRNNIRQHIDWIFSLAMVHCLAKLGQPVIAIGNNMMISRKAYFAIGGYESIPFSLTEDLELFKHVKKKGFKIRQIFSQKVLAFAQPVSGIVPFLQQRKRWMKGAVTLPIHVVLLLFIQAIYFPSLVGLFIYNYNLAIVIMIIKIIFQSTFILLTFKSLKLKYSFTHFVYYEFYSWLVSIGMGFFYLLPIKIKWKGRKY